MALPEVQLISFQIWHRAFYVNWFEDPQRSSLMNTTFFRTEILSFPSRTLFSKESSSGKLLPLCAVSAGISLLLEMGNGRGAQKV